MAFIEANKTNFFGRSESYYRKKYIIAGGRLFDD